jgi:sulfatase maturation enzyme AslB (radical SAM superfamily)
MRKGAWCCRRGCGAAGGWRPEGNCWWRGTETGIVLFPLRPDVRKVYLEVTTRCNLACRTCVRNVWGEPLADMTDATFGRVLEGMRELPDLREVLFGGYGEPFAHPRFLDYLAAVKGLGVRVTVSTNGTLLDEERARALVDIGADVLSVSVDGGPSGGLRRRPAGRRPADCGGERGGPEPHQAGTGPRRSRGFSWSSSP